MHIATLQVLLISIVISGCSSLSHSRSGKAVIAPKDAIMLAADAAPERIVGLFELKVRSTGRDSGNIYLNSEADYRDQRSLNIAIHPQAARNFLEAFGKTPDVFLEGKLIRVSGEAKRTRIGIVCGGRNTEMYYYQTQVHVRDINQIEIMGQ